MDNRCVRTERGHYAFRSGEVPSPVERTEARSLIAVLRDQLEDRAGRRDVVIGAVVAKLHIAMQKPLVGPEAKAVAEVWTDGLVDVPVAAIEEAYQRFNRGTSGLSRTYMPKVPEFAGLARDIAKEWAMAARRLELILERSEIEPEGSPLPPAGAAKLAEWKRQIGGMR